MRKVLIFGNSGSGKSTLAKKLVNEEGLAHLDLDSLAWLSEAPPRRAPIEESRKKIIEFITSNERFVIEGCYSDLLEIAAPRANEVIFMNLSIAKCVQNAKSRPWEPHKYESKEAQDKNLEMLINWIEQYEDREDVFSYQSHLRLYENFIGKKLMYVENESHT
ncbi:AAA family ATPase [Sedimenticola sp.]|uniref:AAA family ATPase n=1 Tax=Sedimenticola sp. TaxID=1940285 RepID=UPI003D113F78